MQKVLVIDDSPAIGSALKVLLGLHDIDTKVALTPQAGLKMLSEDRDIDLVIQDMNFTEDTTSGEEGKALFFAIRKEFGDIPIILLTAWTQLEMAVELVKAGAADYIGKPWDDHRLVVTIANLLELRELQKQQLEQSTERQQAMQELELQANLCGVVYQSAKMQQLIEMAIRIAPSDIPILISGPNGSGKEKIAEIIQANSRVKDGPFIKINVGALPNELMEAELFGAEAGAYTGISKRRIGRFEAADGGTLFLDEIGNLSANGQMKLLRVLQTGEFERLGSNETRQCKVRLISATNADLAAEINAGRFREDLFYRINVIELKLPALKERAEDILPLLHHFLGKSCSLNDRTSEALRNYDWPGNVRELANAAQRAALLCQDKELQISDFGLPINKQQMSVPRPSIEPTKNMIIDALAQNAGVVSQAARQLGLSRQALYRRMEKFDISR